MSISVNSIAESATEWRVDLRVYEGVYRLDHYPVRVVEVPAPPAGREPEVLEQQMARFVLKKARLHMQSGALPPKGMQLKGHAVWETPLESEVSNA